MKIGRMLVTGGSGFIGTNLVAGFAADGWEVTNLDAAPPRCAEHESMHRPVDLLDAADLAGAIRDAQPDVVIHMAARTDLDGRTLDDYAANTVGVKNLLAALADASSVRRVIFASSKLVCPNDYAPKSFTDTCPDTLYGRSKEVGEQIVRDADPPYDWCIVRPTSIWGEWFGVPYRGFFAAVAAGRYVHPRGCNAPKSFGYVGNLVQQVRCLLAADIMAMHRQTFYLSDYHTFTIRRWAEMISQKALGRGIRTAPLGLFQTAGRIGDALKQLGWSNPPMTSFRLKNMLADTSRIPLGNLRNITGNLPYSLEAGVERTLAWLDSADRAK